MPEEKDQKPEARHTRVLGTTGGKIVMQINLGAMWDEMMAKETGEKLPAKEGRVVPMKRRVDEIETIDQVEEDLKAIQAEAETIERLCEEWKASSGDASVARQAQVREAYDRFKESIREKFHRLSLHKFQPDMDDLTTALHFPAVRDIWVGPHVDVGAFGANRVVRNNLGELSLLMSGVASEMGYWLRSCKSWREHRGQ